MSISGQKLKKFRDLVSSTLASITDIFGLTQKFRGVFEAVGRTKFRAHGAPLNLNFLFKTKHDPVFGTLVDIMSRD